MRFSIAKEGIRWFVVFAGLSCVLLLFSLSAAGFALLCGVLICLFYRIPVRYPPGQRGVVLSPADGKIVSVEDVEEPFYVMAPCKRISIFLSIFDVHMNYAPATGIVEWIDYQKGHFHWAFEPKASAANENQRIGIATPLGKMLVRQIAGAIARRIVLFKKVGERVEAGERIGMIKFGSRVEIYIPRNFSIEVPVGKHVVGGLTVLAQAIP